MVRKHGWQLPAHTLQVVAITVYFLLVVAFYAFFAPFLGGKIWEYAVIAVYSPAALSVFIFYVRSTAINPADPGIMSKFVHGLIDNTREKRRSTAGDRNRNFDEVSNGTHSPASSATKSSLGRANSSKKGLVESVIANDQDLPPRRNPFCLFLGGILCAIFVHEDCRKADEASEQEGTGDEALFCTLCNAEVRKFSKHCRSCDKCVDGFDHHCRWLNNCVGRKNYATFILLMGISLIWLAVEVIVGIAVLVRCFVKKHRMEAEIVDRLGNGFSGAPFATVVAICTALSLLACVPLGELFFFHMILIKKGITTYEYVVAMRTMSEAPAGASVDEELPNIVYSPSGSATTGFSGGSSVGLQYRGAWCTPPRVFVDYQEEVAPQLGPGVVPSTVDPDAAGLGEIGTKAPKKGVRISAWKLAKLDSNEAMRAGARARASSSVLRPVDNRRLPDSEFSSSENASVKSSVSTEMEGSRDARTGLMLSPLRNSVPPSQGSRDEHETSTQSLSSLSSPSHVHESLSLSPLPQAHGSSPFASASSAPRFLTPQPLTSLTTLPNRFNPVFPNSLGFDAKSMQKNSIAANPAPASNSNGHISASSLLRDVKRTSVVWDQEAGRYVSVPVTASDRKRPSLPGVVTANTASTERDKQLAYTGDSIFFRGPILAAPSRDGLKSERVSSSSEMQHKLPLTLLRDARYKRDAVSNQIPVFIPGEFERHPPAGAGFR